MNPPDAGSFTLIWVNSAIVTPSLLFLAAYDLVVPVVAHILFRMKNPTPDVARCIS